MKKQLDVNKNYDEVVTNMKVDDFCFGTLKKEYQKQTGNTFTKDDFVLFNLANADGYLTNAGVLFADNNPIRQNRVFCTRWNGIGKTNGMLDDKEYYGSLIQQLKLAFEFYKANTDNNCYSDTAIKTTLANAIAHRDYKNPGVEVCFNIYDDRIDISTPGFEDYQPNNVINKKIECRNPIIANLFIKLGYIDKTDMEIEKISIETNKMFNDNHNHVSLFNRNAYLIVSIEKAKIDY